MAETPPMGTQGDIPEVAVRERRRISTVWLIPIVAAFIGGWLIYKTYSEKGPVITLMFETAEGLEAGKTKVKYKEVQIGTVETVGLSEDISKVVVRAEMVKEATPYLTDSSQFWVVRPRLGVKDISGLGTLVSGAFIEMDPGKGGKPASEFTGLEVPPVIKSESTGQEYVLVADNLGSLSRGSPVNYRGIEVGEVLGHELTENKDKILVHIFVHTPHHELIRPNTRFWNASGLQVSLDADGLQLRTGTLQSLILGGIEFETPTKLAEIDASPPGAQFVLYSTPEDIEEAQFTDKVKLVMYFDGSVRGLTIGAPVEFRGIKLGEVIDINLEIDPSLADFRMPVLVEFEPQRISVLGKQPVGSAVPPDQQRRNWKKFFDRGLRAQLKTGSLLTGQLLVDLDMHPDTPVRLVGTNDRYIEIPTIPTALDEITNSVTALINKIEGLPLLELTERLVSTVEGAESLVRAPEILSAVRTLDRTAKTVEKLVTSVDRNIAPEAAAALEEAHQALKVVREAVSDESPLRYDLETMLRELAASARSIRLLAAYLERNPSALISGKGGAGGQ